MAGKGYEEAGSTGTEGVYGLDPITHRVMVSIVGAALLGDLKNGTFSQRIPAGWPPTAQELIKASLAVHMEQPEIAERVLDSFGRSAS